MTEFSMAYKWVTTSDTMTYKGMSEFYVAYWVTHDCVMVMSSIGDSLLLWTSGVLLPVMGESGLFGQCFGCLLVYM